MSKMSNTTSMTNPIGRTVFPGAGQGPQSYYPPQGATGENEGMCVRVLNEYFAVLSIDWQMQETRFARKSRAFTGN